ncbi:MAG: hypothetical protein Kow00123_01110 [Anaerolineales bacterium]
MKRSWTPVYALALGLLLLGACSPKATPTPMPTPPSGDLETAARYFTNLLAVGNYAEAAAMFDPQMAAAFPVAKLKATWEEVIRNVGDLKGIKEVRMTQEAGYRIAYVACDFARNPLDMKVVFDAQGRIAGLWFVPPGSGGT